MNKYRVKAFTIFEMVITMMITAIVIGITYTSYSIVVKSYNSFNNKNNDMAVVIDLDHVLKRDFERAEIILKDTDGIALKTGAQIIKYQFKPDFITRYGVRIDTFKVQAVDVITAFENMPVNELQVTDEQNRIDEIGFTLLFKNEKIPYHYNKQYSSVNLFQRNPNAIN